MIQKLILNEAHVFRGVTYGPGEVSFDLRDPVQQRAARKIGMVVGDGGSRLEVRGSEPEEKSGRRGARTPKVPAETANTSEGEQA